MTISNTALQTNYVLLAFYLYTKEDSMQTLFIIELINSITYLILSLNLLFLVLNITSKNIKISCKFLKLKIKIRKV